MDKLRTADYWNIYYEGFELGYNDQLVNCPYAEGTEEARAWEEGYKQGCRDC